MSPPVVATRISVRRRGWRPLIGVGVGVGALALRGALGSPGSPPAATPSPSSRLPPASPEGVDAGEAADASGDAGSLGATPTGRSAPEAPDEVSPDDIEQLIRAGERIPKALFTGPFDALKRGWDAFNSALDDATRVRLNIDYTILFQQATGGPGTRSAAGGDLDLVGRWQPLRDVEGWSGTLGFAVEYRHQIGNLPPSDLAGEIGSLWPTTRDFNEQSLGVTELWWEQHMFGDVLVLTVGKTDPKHLYNNNRLGSANYFFMNSAFSDNPARSFPTNGYGVNLRAHPSDAWYVSIGAQQAAEEKNQFNFVPGDPTIVGEVGITPAIEGLGRGHYRFTVWDTRKPNDDDASETGFAISCDQQIGDFIPFLRYAINDASSTATHQILSFGCGMDAPRLRPRDFWGLGAAWGEPSDSSLDDQWVMEGFYRFQLTSIQQLTFGVQLIVNPSDAPGDEAVGVFELRWRVSF